MDCGAGIICAEENSLGLRLVEAGFDLWLNNSRGNKYSRDHMTIDLKSGKKEDVEKYWEFSFTELGWYDQPAVWDYIKNFTGV
jgi:lysosomal acid lipase/cholesteryl ester hydrolase